MDEIRKALQEGRKVDLIWAPFMRKGSSLYCNYGHRCPADEAELDRLIESYGKPHMAFVDSQDYHYTRN